MVLRTAHIGPFRGVVTSLDPRYIPAGAAQDMRDMRVEKGDLRVRPGYGTLLDSVTNQTTNKGFTYAQGVTSAGSFADLYLTVDNVGGVVRLYEIDADILRRTEITVGSQQLSLSDTYWRFAVFDDKVYIFNASSAGTSTDPGPLLEYPFHDYDGLKRIAPPSTPVTPITVDYAKNSSGGAAYQTIRWTGADPLNPATDVTYTSPAQATSSTVSGEAFSIAHAVSGGAGVLGKAKVSIDLTAITAGAQNLTDNDVFAFTLSFPNPTDFQIDPSSIVLYFVNNSAVSATLKVTAFPVEDANGAIVRIECYAKFQDKTRSSWAVVDDIELEYDVNKSSATAANNLMRFNSVTKGGVVDWRSVESGDDPQGWKVGYAWYDTTTDQVSGVGGETELVNAQLLGEVWAPSAGPNPLYLGTIPVLNTTSTSSADKVRIYAARRVKSTSREQSYGPWRQLTEQVDTDTTYVFDTTAAQFEELTEYTVGNFVYNGILCGGQHQGHMAWGYNDGYIRRSRVGYPLLLASDTDVIVADAPDPEDPDPYGGATFRLTDNFTDTAKGFVSCGDVHCILGGSGFYAQVGKRPKRMTAPKTVRGAQGCLGYESFTSWRDDGGYPSVVYVDNNSQNPSCWMVTVAPSFDGDSGAVVTELTKHVRGAIKEFLTGNSQITSPEALMVYVDKEDALNLVYTTRRMRLTRQSLVDGVRDWEFHSYEDGAQGSRWNKVVYSQTRGPKGMRLTGQMDELDWNTVEDSATGYALFSDYTGAAVTPSTTDTTNDNVGFTNDPRFASGTPIVPDATVGGLTANATYYLRKVTFQVWEIYNTANNANATGSTTGRQNLTGAENGNLRQASLGSGGYAIFSVDNSAETVTVKNGPGWVTGTDIKPDTTAGALTSGTTYYVRRKTCYVRYEFYDTEAHAIDFANTTGRVNLTASITASLTPGGRDGGSSIPATGSYWRSKKMLGPRSWLRRVFVDRSDRTETPTITATSESAPSGNSRTLAAGQDWAKFSNAQTGRWHDIKVKVSEDDDPVYGIEIEFSDVSQRRHA